jgi:MoaA/NifB/PqqE/SkfB family radical SAM enzyme
MFESLRTLLHRIAIPGLDWIQVEVTTRCDGACVYCPHGRIRTPRHLPLDGFRKLVPFLRRAGLVFLQGWGEPLLNRDLFEMIRICKRAGRAVGFTTNGMHLTEEAARRLVELEVDVLGVSIAGTSGAVHDSIRRGTRLDTVVSNLDRLRDLKAKAGARVPAVHLAWIMLESNLHELGTVVPLASKLGVSQIVASNLTLIVREALAGEALFNHPEKRDDYRSLLREVREEADHEGVRFEHSGVVLAESPAPCSENIRRACVVGVDGSVGPCVFTTPSVASAGDAVGASDRRHWFRGSPASLSAVTFGNIGERGLPGIWNDRGYRSFRGGPASGRSSAPPMPSSPCVSCHKALGV